MSYQSSKKYQGFTNSPMNPNKPVTAVPGIGRVYGARLCAKGIETAPQLFGVFLQQGEGIRGFMHSLGANTRYQNAVYDAFNTFAQSYVY